MLLPALFFTFERKTFSNSAFQLFLRLIKEHQNHDYPPIIRRDFLSRLGLGTISAAATIGLAENILADEAKKEWKPISDRKIRVGVVGYGVCRFGAAFGFQDHPNVEIVAVSDLYPERRAGLMKACRCEKSYESLEKLVQDPTIEAVFAATDAPSHARHCAEIVKHGKHAMSAVPAAFGSIEDGEKLLEAVEKTGQKYMMAETSTFHADLWAMRQIYAAGGFGRLIYSEGEYYHYFPTPLAAYKEWRTGLPPQWYPTHATPYYIAVTGKRFTEVSCNGFRGSLPHFKPESNQFKNPFDSETAMFRTSEGGSSRMNTCWGIVGAHGEIGRVFGEKGSMKGMDYQGNMKELPNLARPSLPPGVRAGGHGGSHGRLTNEFIMSIIEDRQPLVNVYEALAMTIPGVVAHQSALKDGELLKIPQYLPPKKA